MRGASYVRFAEDHAVVSVVPVQTFIALVACAWSMALAQTIARAPSMPGARRALIAGTAAEFREGATTARGAREPADCWIRASAQSVVEAHALATARAVPRGLPGPAGGLVTRAQRNTVEGNQTRIAPIICALLVIRVPLQGKFADGTLSLLALQHPRSCSMVPAIALAPETT